MTFHSVGSILLAAGILWGSYSVAAPAAVSIPDKMEIVAHRGYSGAAPESTVAAVEAAVEHQADAIEFDMHVTKDGQLVVMHDDTVDRTTNGKGRIKDLAFAQIRKLDAGSKFSPKFKGERVPTLDEVLQAAKGRVLYSEIKGGWTQSDVQKMVKKIVAAGYEQKDLMEAFDYQNFIYVRKFSKTVKLGFLVQDMNQYNRALDLAMQDGNAVLLVNYKMLLADPSLITRGRAKGIDVGCWTVDRMEDAKKIKALGVKRIITNQLVDQLRESRD